MDEVRTVIVGRKRDDLPEFPNSILLPFEHAVMHKGSKFLDFGRSRR